MKRIFKYVLDIADEQRVSMPMDAKPLHVAMQHGDLCLWAEVEDTRLKSERVVRIFGTGHPVIPSSGAFSSEVGDYVGTVLMVEGNLVWHVYVQ